MKYDCRNLVLSRQKNQKNDFSENYFFLLSTNFATRRTPCTPSGNPKLNLWLSLLIPKLFSYPLKNTKKLKKSIDFFSLCFFYIPVYIFRTPSAIDTSLSHSAWHFPCSFKKYSFKRIPLYFSANSEIPEIAPFGITM